MEKLKTLIVLRSEEERIFDRLLQLSILFVELFFVCNEYRSQNELKERELVTKMIVCI